MRGTLPLLLLLAACGRTEPVGDPPPLPVEVEPEHPAEAIPDAGVFDGGTDLIVAGQCQGINRICPRGFHCESGTCVLNGAQSDLQVTLQWKNNPRTNDDLDLHLLEPLPGGGSCEIYFGSSGIFGCGAVGTLDLDANGACADTDPSGGAGADTENIIYPTGRAPPKGHYIVRVDFWGDCSNSSQVPFVVTVRNAGVTTRREGLFRSGEADQGEKGSGITVVEFDVQ